MDLKACLEHLPEPAKRNVLMWCPYSSVIALGKTCTAWREFIHIPNQNLPIKRIMVKFGENCSRLQVGSSFASGKNQNSNLLSVQYQLVGGGCAVIYENSLSRGQKKLESEDYQDLFKEDLKILRKLLGNSILEYFEVDCETFQCSMQRRNLKNQFESFLKTITDIWAYSIFMLYRRMRVNLKARLRRAILNKKTPMEIEKILSRWEFHENLKFYRKTLEKWEKSLRNGGSDTSEDGENLEDEDGTEEMDFSCETVENQGIVASEAEDSLRGLLELRKK
ncbi:Protein CBG14398 [Caenorhabditis briggsae]|uniref:Protein CBG14398 n=1 Tax=Caenorhabditis briggsae TaxID=6238 RepID=A8XJX1_CAEBR|nr:Protein CBG14398 [Caenorhabditis briggsae]CAP32947.1 Protein CBG14398 [Caenorhabditis briggsae]